MIALNELGALKCNKREIIEPIVVLLSPFAPHICEELWNRLGHNESISFATFPEYVEAYTVENTFEYPVSFNGKMRFKMTFPKDMPIKEVEKGVIENPQTAKYLDGGSVKKIIVVPCKIINIVVAK